jgi:5-methylcytosine-specific restriction endonuclease McrA
MTFSNLKNNPAKNPEARRKIVEYARHRGNTHMMTKEAREKAVIGISKALKGRHLSDAHKAAIGLGSKRAGCKPPRNLHLVGRNHPNWQGGFSTIRNKEFHKPGYKLLCKSVFARDNYTCQDCQKRGGKLEAHHIKPWGPYPDLRYALHNLITLCPKCHKSRHRGVPRPVTVGPRTLSESQ